MSEAPQKVLRVAIVAHGRFNSFDIARAMQSAGHQVSLYTNYPAWAVKRFKVDPKIVISNWWSGVTQRLYPRLGMAVPNSWSERFGQWAANELGKRDFDLVLIWSSVAEEYLHLPKTNPSTVRVIVRESAHIQAQYDLLVAEEIRSGAVQDKPSTWSLAREQREYPMADAIMTRAGFSRQSFLDHGSAPEQVFLVKPDAFLDRWRADATAVAGRVQRLNSAEPIRVLFVGSLCFRKGLLDLRDMVLTLHQQGFKFTLTGQTYPEGAVIAEQLSAMAKITGRLAETELGALYAENDVFVFPTIEDGAPAVVVQAAAALLPILSTPNCSWPEIQAAGALGQILPARNPAAFIAALQQFKLHRMQHADAIARLHASGALHLQSAIAPQIEQMYCDVHARNIRCAL